MSQAEETLERLRKQAGGEDGEQEGVVEEGDTETAQMDTGAEDGEGGEGGETGVAKKSSTRDYVVLMNVGGGQFKLLGDAINAASGEAAILSLGEKQLQGGSEYIAVPVRNWTKAIPKVETTTIITLE